MKCRNANGSFKKLPRTKPTATSTSTSTPTLTSASTSTSSSLPLIDSGHSMTLDDAASLDEKVLDEKISSLTNVLQLISSQRREAELRLKQKMLSDTYNELNELRQLIASANEKYNSLIDFLKCEQCQINSTTTLLNCTHHCCTQCKQQITHCTICQTEITKTLEIDGNSEIDTNIDSNIDNNIQTDVHTNIQ